MGTSFEMGIIFNAGANYVNGTQFKVGTSLYVCAHFEVHTTIYSLYFEVTTHFAVCGKYQVLALKLVPALGLLYTLGPTQSQVVSFHNI